MASVIINNRHCYDLLISSCGFNVLVFEDCLIIPSPRHILQCVSMKLGGSGNILQVTDMDEYKMLVTKKSPPPLDLFSIVLYPALIPLAACDANGPKLCNQTVDLE